MTDSGFHSDSEKSRRCYVHRENADSALRILSAEKYVSPKMQRVVSGAERIVVGGTICSRAIHALFRLRNP
jgi:hypothetical protein